MAPRMLKFVTVGRQLPEKRDATARRTDFDEIFDGLRGVSPPAPFADWEAERALAADDHAPERVDPEHGAIETLVKRGIAQHPAERAICIVELGEGALAHLQIYAGCAAGVGVVHGDQVTVRREIDVDLRTGDAALPGQIH